MKGLKSRDIAKMDIKARSDKLKELRIELIKSRRVANSSKVRTKEIKKAIARLLTVARAARMQPTGGAH